MNIVFVAEFMFPYGSANAMRTRSIYQLNQGIQCWVYSVANADLKHKNVSAEFKKAGYDINSLAEWLQDFYLHCTK